MTDSLLLIAGFLSGISYCLIYSFVNPLINKVVRSRLDDPNFHPIYNHSFYPPPPALRPPPPPRPNSADDPSWNAQS